MKVDDIMAEDDDVKIEDWLENWETKNGTPKSVDDLYSLALSLRDDIPLGYDASRIFADWLSNVRNSIKSSSEEKGEIYDSVNHPFHYTSQGNVECIDAIENSMPHEAFEGYLKGNILKYIWRYRNKYSPIQDLQKAKCYLDMLIELLKKEES